MGVKENRNVVMIMTDQMHKYALGAVSDFVKTPNLDKLAERGTLFTNCYSNNPVCTPFRGLLFSGRYSAKTGCMNNCSYLLDSEVCLGDEIGKIGYESSFIGKLHLGDKGNVPVEKRFFAGNTRFLGYQCHNGFQGDISFFDENQREHKFYGHRTDITGKLGAMRIQELVEEDKNFVATVFFQAPHYPVQPTYPFEKMYDGVVFPEPEEYSYIEPFTGTGSPFSPLPIQEDPDFQRYGGDFQAYWKLYYAMVSQIDHNVGLIIDKLEELGIRENTAIIFSSDHGDMQGSHGKLNKCIPYERSCGIPLIVDIPGMEQRKVVDTPVSALDFYPTCMDLVGLESTKKLDGVSLMNIMTPGQDQSHPDVICENMVMGPWVSIRTGQYKYVEHRDTREPELLFDMINDPTEAVNLVGKEAYAQVQQELKEKLDLWWEEVTAVPVDFMKEARTVLDKTDYLHKMYKLV